MTADSNLQSVFDWLGQEGRFVTDYVELCTSVAKRLVAAGVPLGRMRVSFRTIHPQMLALSFVWNRDRGHELDRIAHGIQDTDAYLGSPIQHVMETGQPYRRRLLDLDRERDHSVLFEIKSAGLTDYVAVPMRFSTGDLNIVALACDDPAGFRDQDVEQFVRLADALAPVVELVATRRLARILLDTYVGSRAGDRVLKGLIRRGDVERIRAALWISDLRGFTALSERLDDRQLLDTLNLYFEHVAAATTARGGEILKFIGDAVLVIFPDGPGVQSDPCQMALDAAIDALDSLATVNHRQRRWGRPEIRFGVGLHVGEVVYGNIGAPDRLDFTVLGPAVNRTARLESLSARLGQPIVMTREFAERVAVPVSFAGTHELKGIDEPQAVYVPAITDSR
jgi:adenylate cyclase